MKLITKGRLSVAMIAFATLLTPYTALSQLNYAMAGNNGTVPTPPGLYVTPLAPLKNANQQPLNPGLQNYPNFVAGEAVKALVSADGNTLAILTAGQNSLVSSNGPAIDAAASTQFIFLYDLRGQDLRPFASGAPNGTKGGTFPYSVVITGSAASGFTAYVGSDRDREVVVVSLTVNQPTGKGSVITRIPLDGNANGMTLSADGSTLYVAQDNSDELAAISTASNAVTAKVDTRGPASLAFLLL